ncbi:GNAT family N-acetyltransferase, partial [Candidatus Bipolaricaulota bacterium]|nr:GNAT family N-acetyltransferase [Candidatus Bipolaricaulota bacterium]
GAACWLAPGATRTTLFRTIRTGMGLPFAVTRFPRADRLRFLQVASFLDACHERHMPTPHWYLWALGVKPSRQRQGVGTALLQPVLARADHEDCACYLETATPENVPFYEKLGFRVLWEANVAQQPIHLWFMRRDPSS